MNLVDEKGYEFDTKYFADRTALSGGWRGFAVAQKLVDGDACVFQLIKPTTLKVTKTCRDFTIEQ
jgi:B3 DNA binding domain